MTNYLIDAIAQQNSTAAVDSIQTLTHWRNTAFDLKDKTVPSADELTQKAKATSTHTVVQQLRVDEYMDAHKHGIKAFSLAIIAPLLGVIAHNIEGRFAKIGVWTACGIAAAGFLYTYSASDRYDYKVAPNPNPQSDGPLRWSVWMFERFHRYFKENGK